MQELLAEVAAVASAAGYAPNEQHVALVRGVVTTAGSDVTASMFRDIQGGGRIEGGHIVGDLLRRARRLGVATPLLRIANVHLQAYEAERRKAAS